MTESGERTSLKEWKYILLASLVTIAATAIMVILLPDGPLEFW